MPRLHQIDKRHADRLEISNLRDWDCRAEPAHLKPLKPFTTVEKWIDPTRAIFHTINPDLSTDFDLMVNNNLLDIEARPNKANFVGYQQFLKERRVGFIFAYPKFNHRDVETLLHECGHAFHTLAYQHQPLTWNRSTPFEFAETVANAMQIIGGEHLKNTFYNAPDAARARISQLEGIVANLAYTARGEAFLHYLHTTPKKTELERLQHST